MDVDKAPRRTTSPAARVLPWVLGVPATLVFLLVGLWLFAGVLAPGYYSSFVLSAVWFVLALVVLGAVRRRVPALNRPLRVTYLATAVVLVVVVSLTTFRDDTVDEEVVAAGAGNEQVASGEFSGKAHDASGTAAVVRLADGSTNLTFTDLDTDNGPDLRVYLVAGDVESDADVEDFRDLGALKGNKGTQQYAVPADVDLDRYATVVVWCRAVSIAFATAELESA
jgi:hypothetical protein